LEDHNVPGSRLTRQELKTQDEITSSLKSFTELVETKKKEFLIGIGVLLVVVAGIVGWRAYSGRRDAAASVQLASAIAAFEDSTVKPDKTRYEKSAAEAQKTIDSYGSTSAGLIAKYYLAMSQERLGDAAAAEKNLQDVVDHGDSEIKGIAQYALARVQSSHDGSPKAIENLKKLYDSGNYPKSAVAFDLASLYETGGQKDLATQYYSKVILDSPESRFRADAESALKRMGVPVPSPPPPAALQPSPAKKP
jgi:predicted negative regulator of RcsB-dependent stress response